MIETCHTPNCSGKEIPLYRVSDLNRRIGSHEFQYLYCEHCGLIRLEHPPLNLGAYYTDEYYAIPTIDDLSEAAVNSFKIDLIQRFVPSGRLLEIGPAYGTFSFQAKQAGFIVDAIEMDARCVEHLKQVVGINVVQSASPHETITSFGLHEVIALWHVIEHLPDPWALLRAAAKNLVPGGILVLAAPNPSAWQFKVMGKEWPHLDAPRHLYLLPEKVLTEYVKTLGLDLVHITTTDSDAKSWNRFGWQRFLMNRVRGKWLERMAFIMGYGLSLLLYPFEAKDPKGSAYTLVFRRRG